MSDHLIKHQNSHAGNAENARNTGHAEHANIANTGSKASQNNQGRKGTYLSPKVNLGDKSLFETYGKYAVLGLLFLCIGIGAWQVHNYQKNKELLIASKQYDVMIQAIKDRELSKIDGLAAQIIEEHPNTPYAPLAALFQARIQVDRNQLEKAEESLNTAIELSEPGPTFHIAKVRLARVLAAEQKFEEALEILSTDNDDNEGYVSLYEETKGDIYVQQKDLEKAREAYKAAEQALPPGIQVVGLQLKQNNIKISEDQSDKSKIDSNP